VHTMRYAERDLHAFWPVMLDAFGSPAPASFDYRGVDPDISVWGWTFHADPHRAPEFLEIRGAGPSGLTLTGSGTETVVTAAMFRPHQPVTVSGAQPEAARADAEGWLTIRVDLGPPHTEEQFSPGSSQPDFVTRVVHFTPSGTRP